MPPPLTVFVLPSAPGLPVSAEPAQLHPIPYQPAQASVCHGVPGPPGAAGQLLQLPTVLQLPTMPAPGAPAHGWGQQLGTGTLVPHRPMGLGQGAVLPWEPLCPKGSGPLHAPARPAPLTPHRPNAQHWLQGPPLLHTLPGSTQNPAQASNKDGAAINDSDLAASPHQPATTTKPKGEFWGLAEPPGGRPN